MHTPAPWEVGLGINRFICGPTSSDRRTVDEQVANQQLVEAAPAMLEALQALAAVMPTNHADADDPAQAAAWQKCVDAIAKATGEDT